MPADEMDSLYSIGVNNRFIGIDNDSCDDPLELIRAAQEKPKKEKDVKAKGKKDVKITKGTKEKTVKIESPTESESTDNKKPERTNRGRGRGRGGRGRGSGERRGRGGRGGGFGSATSPGEQGFGFDNNNSISSGFNDNTPTGGFKGGFGSPTADNQNDGFGSGFGGGFGSNENDGDRRGGRSGYRGRGGRGRGRGGRGGREFDRRSGSDKSSVKAFEKRDGSGSYNWGTPQDELAASEEQVGGGFGAPGEKSEDSPATENTTEQPTETEETGVEEKQEDAGPQEMTFDEWKKQQDEARSKPQFNIRKVEGEKKGMKQLKKPTEEENEADGSLFFPKKYYEERFKSSGRVKERVDIDFQFGSGDNRHLDLERGRRGGRGRGARSGRGGRKNDFPGAQSAEIALENTEEFPSL